MRMQNKRDARRFAPGQFMAALAALLLGIVAVAYAVTLPNTFTAGTPAVADQVNANFTAVKDAIGALEAKVDTGVKYSGLDNYVTLGATGAVIHSITVTAPASGHVIVQASGYFDGFGGAGVARCSVTTGTTVDYAALILGEVSDNAGANTYVPFASTRGFSVAAGPNVFNLVCEAFTGAPTIADTQLTAIFASMQY